ncbi:MAG: class I SAM-dependent methyltransferase [Candidatus Melainabacteria bacterium]|nr:class I SAM-dependent methyltransferase [Candidatus Melainabacteria bacterium]
MTNEHLYIALADKSIKDFVEKEVTGKTNPEVIEIGCGPARITPLFLQIPNIHLTAIDYDLDFIDHAKKILKPYDSRVKAINADVSTYVHPRPVDVFYSEGFHHHVQKGEVVNKYLTNVYSQLKNGGAYILGDENLSEYTSSEDRLIKVIVWYAHIISNAKKSGFNYLAQEEAKTLLDDLYENYDDEALKSKEQIDLVLNWVDKIDETSSENVSEATLLAKNFLEILKQKRNLKKIGDTTIDLSRGDFKVSDSVFRKEVQGIGFKVEKVERIGPSKDVGGLYVYLLRK